MITVVDASAVVPDVVAPADAWVTASSTDPSPSPVPARTVPIPSGRVPPATASTLAVVTGMADEATVPTDRRPWARASWSTENVSENRSFSGLAE